MYLDSGYLCKVLIYLQCIVEQGLKLLKIQVHSEVGRFFFSVFGREIFSLPPIHSLLRIFQPDETDDSTQSMYQSFLFSNRAIKEPPPSITPKIHIAHQ